MKIDIPKVQTSKILDIIDIIERNSNIKKIRWA